MRNTKINSVKLYVLLVATAILAISADAAITRPGDELIFNAAEQIEKTPVWSFSVGPVSWQPQMKRLGEQFLRRPEETIQPAAGYSLLTHPKVMVLLFGFMCVTLIRDRRLWAAALCILVYPVFGIRHKESMLHTFQTTVRVHLHKSAMNRDYMPHQVRILSAAKYIIPLAEKTQQYEIIHGLISQDWFKQPMRLNPLNVMSQYSKPGYLSIFGILSRPPPDH